MPSTYQLLSYHKIMLVDVWHLTLRWARHTNVYFMERERVGFYLSVGQICPGGRVLPMNCWHKRIRDEYWMIGWLAWRRRQFGSRDLTHYGVDNFCHVHDVAYKNTTSFAQAAWKLDGRTGHKYATTTTATTTNIINNNNNYDKKPEKTRRKASWLF